MAEVVVGAAIIAVTLVAMIVGVTRLGALGQNNLRLTQSALLLEEGAEILRIWRDQDWTNIANLTPGNNYYYAFNGSSWATSTVLTMIDSTFERKFQITAVNRDSASQNISSSGVVDTGTRLATITVSWNDHVATTTQTLSLYLTNI